MSCSDHLTMPFAGPLAAGEWRFEVRTDARTWSCFATVPVEGDPGALPCDGTEVELYTERKVGGMTAPAGFHLTELPATVEVQVWRDGTLVLHETISPEYREHRPNGEDCEPVCRVAEARLAFQGHQ